jgi:hypothetical protein
MCFAGELFGRGSEGYMAIIIVVYLKITQTFQTF